MGTEWFLLILYVACSSFLMLQHRAHVKDLRGYRDYWQQRYRSEAESALNYRKALIQCKDPTQTCMYCRKPIEIQYGFDCPRCLDKDKKQRPQEMVN